MTNRLISFGYFGGKFSKLDFILPQLLTPHIAYVEVCVGSAAVMLNKPTVKHEIINDIAGEVADFWRAIREHPDELQRAIDASPAGEAEFKRIASLPPTDDIVEHARRFFVHIRQTFNNLPKRDVHVFDLSFPYLNNRNLAAVASRMSNVVVENSDASRLIKRAVKWSGNQSVSPILFYADPPYLDSTRKSAGDYIHDKFDHEKFLDTVTSQPPRAKFAISGYPSALYNDALKDWHRVDLDTPLYAGPTKGQRRTEVLWRNYSIETTDILQLK